MSKENIVNEDPSQERRALLKEYLQRLGAGEDLDAVRADFVANFSDVEASEIMHAEQELLAEGTPLNEVQRLCDVHSALFHGSTRAEKIENAEKEVEASLLRKSAERTPQEMYAYKKEKAAELCRLKGHPLYTMTKENEALSALIEEAKDVMPNAEEERNVLEKIREVTIHYAKKGDLFYPHMKVKYGISGPSDVMWTVDDEVRDELSALCKAKEPDEFWLERVQTVLKRAEEMIYKESNILFPICAVNFTEEEWHRIYAEMKNYPKCLAVEPSVWIEGEETASKASADSCAPQNNGEIVMPGGHMKPEELTALLNTIPMEISFIDADNINRFFNEGPKDFKRPQMALDREVFACHPPKIEPMVRAILADFRSGAKDSIPVWMEKNGKTMLVTYMAVRDRNGKYLGTAEFVQNMEFAKDHFMKTADR